MKHLRKSLPYLSGQIEHIFLAWVRMEHARLGAASCFVFSGDPPSPIWGVAVSVDWESPFKWPWQFQQQQSTSSGRKKALKPQELGLEGGRWEVSQGEGSLRSYILGRLHVLPRQPLKWLHLISMVLITSDRKPSIQGSSIKQTNSIWREDKRVSTCACKIDWVLYNTVNGRRLYSSSFFMASNSNPLHFLLSQLQQYILNFNVSAGFLQKSLNIYS